MRTFTLAEAQLVALFLGSISYGVHIATFALCMTASIWTKSGFRSKINLPMVFFTTILFIVGTMEAVFNVLHNLNGFVYYSGPGGAEEEFLHISNWLNVMKVKLRLFIMWRLSSLTSTIADSALIYRCWIIFNHTWPAVAFPLLLLVSQSVCATAEIYYTATLERSHALADVLSKDRLRPFVTAYGAITITLNVLTTGECLIVYRIWTVHRESSRFFTQSIDRTSSLLSLSEINRILIESALLYTVGTALTFVLSDLGSTVVYPVADFTLQLGGISFDLIIIRVSGGRGVEHTQKTVQRDQSEFTLEFARSRTRRQSGVAAIPVTNPVDSSNDDRSSCIETVVKHPQFATSFEDNSVTGQ
ncbi:uncharacterized protein LAESUDRAFT_701677 [Laetiporus sulphureus 93-53]|uniref:Family A G protein-coupled receptor-like protein n=1 Tax=Laetiporus sulphureus 93-53 TaxID=1314785 RepID=A0A165DW92_9APHY|nr:uncharacterized protein LAESUDRAFT_701677 [Laetiporus sulphureus 93-53]KZT05758.1 hypothetical protein LAESUDRAFT_701677 [Laetiporus sulphureus 93-53]